MIVQNYGLLLTELEKFVATDCHNFNLVGTHVQSKLTFLF